MDGFNESGLFLIGEVTGIQEVVRKATGVGGFGLYSIMVKQDVGWDAKADFSLTDIEQQPTRLGTAYKAGELQHFVGRRCAIRVVGVPSKTAPQPGKAGYVNYRAVSVVALDEGGALAVVPFNGQQSAG